MCSKAWSVWVYYTIQYPRGSVSAHWGVARLCVLVLPLCHHLQSKAWLDCIYCCCPFASKFFAPNMFEQKFCFACKMFQEKYFFAPQTFEQKSCFAFIMVEQKSCFAFKMVEQKSCFAPTCSKNKSLFLQPTCLLQRPFFAPQTSESKVLLCIHNGWTKFCIALHPKCLNQNLSSCLNCLNKSLVLHQVDLCMM